MRLQGFVEIQHRTLGSKTKIAYSSLAIGTKAREENIMVTRIKPEFSLYYLY